MLIGSSCIKSGKQGHTAGESPDLIGESAMMFPCCRIIAFIHEESAAMHPGAASAGCLMLRAMACCSFGCTLNVDLQIHFIVLHFCRQTGTKCFARTHKGYQ